MKYLIASSLLILLSFQVPQKEKTYTLTLTQQEVQIVYEAIDNASYPGNIRKPLLQKIESQFAAQNKPDTLKQKK